MTMTSMHLDPASGVRAQFIDTAGQIARRALSDCISGRRCRLAYPFDRITQSSTDHRYQNAPAGGFFLSGRFAARENRGL